nr:glucan endo-1,3-beta-glucosidase 7 [Tanacetum cinerariifolium]
SEEAIIPMESLRTHDSSLPISFKIDSLLDEFAGELTLLKLISPGIDKADCDLEEDIRLIEKLLYDNSSPRPPEEFVFANSEATTESFYPSPIFVKDNDSLMEEIDLFCTPDYPMLPGIEDEDSDSERDILIPKNLPSNNSLLFAEKESVYFDIPPFSRLNTVLLECFWIYERESDFFLRSQSYVGVNYGLVADNLPPPSATAKLLQSTSIGKVRLYNPDPAIIKALANTNIGITIGASNADIPAFASDVNFAKSWITANVLAYPSSKIILINVGGKIKVSTVHSMSVLGSSEPPSAGRFSPSVVDLLKGLLEFNKANASPFMINPYPFFAYQDDPRPDTLAFCLFEPNAGRPDSGTNIKYTNMFDAQ